MSKQQSLRSKEDVTSHLQMINEVHRKYTQLTNEGLDYILKISRFCHAILELSKGDTCFENHKYRLFQNAIECGEMLIKLSLNPTYSYHFIEEVKTCFYDINSIFEEGKTYLNIAV